MIGKLKGTVDAVGEAHAIVDVNGVGYEVQASARTLRGLQPGQEATLAIERIDRPVVSQAHTVGPLESLPLVADYVRKEPIRFMEVQEKHLALLEPNAVMDVSKELPGAMGGQTYMHGLIQIAPDEALILEFDPPVDSPYWGVQLLDYFYNTLDVRRMPSSLNGP